ncbi:hypothetical protein AAFP35_00195 [Gordonia sp. CPCC 206044]|uniref:hypothetical protein n=1 Tax=Gordonia sp. CPCC 206044 TaxID=3140793 RepID=UPI003AF374A5
MAFPAPDRSAPTSPWKIVGLVVGVAILLCLMVIAFALPAARSAPNDVPVGVVGTPAQVAQVEQRASGFELTRYSDPDDARSAILNRDVYGAIVFGPQGPQGVLVSSAASPTVATLLTAAGQRMGVTEPTIDVRAFPADDPKGAGLAAGALPLALGGWIAAMVIMLLIPSNVGRLVAAACVSVVGGLALVATLQFLIGTFDGNYWLTALAGMLGIAATCFMVLGFRELLGGIGLVIAAILLIFLGNPLSGLASAPELLPSPWGALGQLLPPGATGTLLRDVVFFEGNGMAHALVVLLGWLAVGLLLYGAGMIKARRKASAADTASEPNSAVPVG